MTKTFLLDLVERCAKTFVATFIGLLTASGLDVTNALTNVSTLQRAAVAGLGAVATIVLSVLSLWATSRNGTASLVPDVIDADLVRQMDPGR